MDKREIRKLLIITDHQNFDAINNQEILGASNHIRMIGEMFKNIALDAFKANITIDALKEKINKVAEFFIITRGQASQAVSNAIYLMTTGVHEITEDDTLETATNKIIRGIDVYAVKSKESTDKCIKYAINLLRDYKNIFIYDYSSTVEKTLIRAGNDDDFKHIFIAESAVINGGVPYVETLQNAGHTITFFADASMMYFLKKADIALMGAETFYPDGTGFNTIGSDIVGLVCKNYGIPLYFITPMVKVDARPLFGKKKEIVFNTIKARVESNFSNSVNVDSIDFETPELLGIPASQITGFITEKGIIPSGSMYQESMHYLNELRGGSLDEFQAK